MLKFVLGLIALLSVSPAHAFDYTIVHNHSGHAFIRMDGIIEPDMSASTFEDFYKKALAYTPIEGLIVNSRGGAVEDAMTIAKRIETDSLAVIVADHGECNSACNLLLLASPHRVIQGSGAVGIHHAGLCHVQEHRLFACFDDEAVEKTMSTFFKSHGVPDFIISQMDRTPMQHIYYLTQAELQAIKIVRIEPSAF